MRPAPAPTVAAGRRAIFALKTPPAKTVKAAGALSAPERRLKVATQRRPGRCVRSARVSGAMPGRSAEPLASETARAGSACGLAVERGLPPPPPSRVR